MTTDLTPLEEIKKYIKSDKLIFGTDETLKSLRKGTLDKVFLAAKTKQSTSEDFNHYAKLAKVEVIQLDLPNDELGTFCKKPYSISVIVKG